MSHETVARIIEALLEVLGDVGVPGASAARLAIRGVESLRKSQAARRRLEELLQQAEEDFLQEARREGLEPVARWVTSLPLQNLPAFRQALEDLRTHWDEESLTDRLAGEFARIPAIREAQKARALALYMTCLRRQLLADNDFRQVVVSLSILRTEEGVERLLEGVDALYRALNRLIGLPEDLVAWPVETLDAAAIRELRADLLLPRYRLVPYTGKAFRQTLEDLLAWARGLKEAQPLVGLRIYIGPGGAGKTRLLIEAGEALRREGWWTGFLRAGRLTPTNARLLTADARPTLLIADYIANRPDEARTLLREAARACRERTAPWPSSSWSAPSPNGCKRTFRTTPTPNTWAGRPSSASPRWRRRPGRCPSWTRRTVGRSSGRPGRGSRPSCPPTAAPSPITTSCRSPPSTSSCWPC